MLLRQLNKADYRDGKHIIRYKGKQGVGYIYLGLEV
jgi:hypothetical protein